MPYLYDDMLAAVASLPDEQALVLELRYGLQPCSIEEIAAILNCTRGEACGKIATALTALNYILHPLQGAPS